MRDMARRITRFNDEAYERSSDVSKVAHLDKIAFGAESKCITCKHYCKNGAQAQIVTVSEGKKTWHVGANYCTILGYFPLKKRFPISLSSPIGPDGHVLELPEVVECSEYQRGEFLKMNVQNKIEPKIEPIDLSITESAAIMKESEEYFHQQLKKSSGIPLSKFADQKPLLPKTLEVPIEFERNKLASLPHDCDEIIEIAVGPLKFKENVDFTRHGGYVSWTNPAFTVGPQAIMTVKYTVK